MFFSLFCNVFCTCLHYWYVKIYWENRLQREQTHVRTITLHAHDYILLVMVKWNRFTKPCYSDPAPPGLWWFTSFSCRSTFYLFVFSQLWTIDCGKAQSRSSRHSNPQQQPTLLFRHFVVIFFLFWTFEQIWVGFDTLVTVKKLPAGRHAHIDGKPQQQSDDNINSFFFLNFLSL